MDEKTGAFPLVKGGGTVYNQAYDFDAAKRMRYETNADANLGGG